MKANDFIELGKKADKLIDEYGNIRVLINAANFNGVEKTIAAEKIFIL